MMAVFRTIDGAEQKKEIAYDTPPRFIRLATGDLRTPKLGAFPKCGEREYERVEKIEMPNEYGEPVVIYGEVWTDEYSWRSKEFELQRKINKAEAELQSETRARRKVLKRAKEAIEENARMKKQGIIAIGYLTKALDELRRTQC